MQLITLLASTEDAAHSHSIIDALPHLAGMLMVMVTLTILWGVCAFTAKMVGTFLPDKKNTTAPAPATATPAATAPEPAPPAESGIAPEIVAVIAAAVAAVTDKRPVRIVSIKPTSTSWERAGRQSVLTSHRIR
ncbi:MAG: OadG family protein [Akkermansiaceae bacterium]|jgi:sodium pump decarboxylase gamma subunit|nr:OadG family protein [Akkermansiaceae bacterium]